MALGLDRPKERRVQQCTIGGGASQEGEPYYVGYSLDVVVNLACRDCELSENSSASNELDTKTFRSALVTR